MELKITIPESLKDIRLGDYQKYMEIIESNEDEMFIAQKKVQYFCNTTLLAVTRMKRKDFHNISAQIDEVLQDKPKLKPRVSIKGKEYGFIPDLDKDMEVGEFADLNSYLKNWKDFHKAMNVLYRPITSKKGGRYLIEPYEGDESTATTMLDMDMETVTGSIVFFSTLGKQLLAVTPKYLEIQLAKMKNKEADLVRNGDGINTYINSLEGVCSRLTELLPSSLAQH